MQITFYGTGGAFNNQYGNNAALLEFDGTNLLLDCGHTVPRYIEHKRKISDVNNIFITHMHGDHVGGLEELMFRNRYINNGKKPNLFIPSDILDVLRTYLSCTTRLTNEGECNLEDYFNVYSVNNTFRIKNEVFQIGKTRHILNAPAYMLVGNGFIYTGDSRLPDWTTFNLNKINYIFHDTSLHKYNDDDPHASLEDMIKLQEDIRKKIYSMHYGADIDQFKKSIIDNKMNVVESFKTIILK
jgi:mRNA degradation ribonuclease J1/J2